MMRLGLAVVMVVLLGIGAGQAQAGPIGPPCNGCSDGFYYNGSGCSACSNGAADYDCGPGSYKTGQPCIECSSDSDTQTCALCGNGGADYDCPDGSTEIGAACTGTGTSDTQTCGDIAPAVSNHNAIFLAGAMLLTGLWSVRRLARGR